MAGVIINIVAKGKYSMTEVITQKRIKFFSNTNNENNEYNSLLNAIINSLNGSATMLKFSIQSNYLKKVSRLISNSETASSSLERKFLSKLDELSNKKLIKFEELSTFEESVLKKHLYKYIEEERTMIQLKNELENNKTELPTAEAEINIEGDEFINIITTDEESINIEDEVINIEETFDSFDPDSVIISEEFEQTSPSVINLDDI